MLKFLVPVTVCLAAASLWTQEVNEQANGYEATGCVVTPKGKAIKAVADNALAIDLNNPDPDGIHYVYIRKGDIVDMDDYYPCYEWEWYRFKFPPGIWVPF